MTERELRKLEATIRSKMEDIKKQRVSLKDSGIGGLMNSLKKVDEALYEKILPEYKQNGLLCEYFQIIPRTISCNYSRNQEYCLCTNPFSYEPY